MNNWTTLFFLLPDKESLDIISTLHLTGIILNYTYMHSKMKEKEIEDVFLSFTNGDIQCLISTNIIESGIDIKNANTLIIFNSNLFGLSQLYQLRGRVGRSNRRAYAYLFLSHARRRGLDHNSHMEVWELFNHG